MFDTPGKLALGLLTGIVFGFLLHKGRVTRYEVIVGQFLLADWTVAKIMGTAMLVGAVGVYTLVGLGWASLHIKPFLLGGALFGGICFGIGIVVFGYCPGTGVAACGAGRRDAMVGVLGMLAGAAVFVALDPLLQPLIRSLGDRGKLTLPQVLGVSPWLLLAVLIGAAVVAATWYAAASRRDLTTGIEGPSGHAARASG